MATDTTKITGAADDLSDKLTKGGSAAKTLGAEIANAIKSLDTRVSAIEAGGGTQPPIEPPPTQDTTGKITSFSAESTKIDADAWQCHSARKAHSMTKVDDYELRFEIRQGERMSWDGDYCERSSIQRMQALSGSTPIMNPVGSTFSARYRLWIEPGSPGASYFFVLSQAHNDDTASGVGTSPPVALEFVNEKLLVYVRHCPTNQNPGNNAGNVKMLTIWTDAQKTARGVWHEVKIEAKNANDASGYCRVTLNGAQVANYTGPVGFGRSVYWEFGPYRATDPTTFAIKYRNIVHT